MDKEKIIELLKKVTLEREKAKESFYKFDGMILAYEQLLKDIDTVVS